LGPQLFDDGDLAFGPQEWIFISNSPPRYLLWVTQYYFWFPLVEKYLSLDADLLFVQRNLWRSEFSSVASKDNRCEALIRVLPAEVQEGRRGRRLRRVPRRRHQAAHRSIFTDVTSCFLGVEGSRMGRNRPGGQHRENE
jgi:hypothetical protein